MRYIIILIALLFLPALSSEAQVVQYGEQQLTIELDPLTPGPEDYFTATVDDYALPIQGSTIRWYVDGKERTEDQNKRVINLTAKKSGELTRVTVSLTLPDNRIISAEREIRPNFLDIIIEPQTRTPAFYKGRSLPSIASKINATAIVNGNALSPNNLIYTWSLNGDILENGAVRGKNSITFTMPQGRFATLGLQVRTPAGDEIGNRLFEIPSVTPTLSFYEMSTLYGLKQKAAGDRIPLLGDSITLRAEPYHLDLATYLATPFLEWKVGGVKSYGNSNNPYEITLKPAADTARAGNGSTNVEFHVRNLDQVLQGSQGNVLLTY